MQIKKTVKKFSILLPLVFCIFLIIYFIYIFEYFNKSYFETRYRDAKATVNIIADSIDSLKKNNVPDDIIYNKILNESLSSLDKDSGIYIRLLNLNFENIDISSHLLKEDFNWTGGLDISSPELLQLQQDILNKSTGEFCLETPIGGLNLYWKQIPYTNPQYYLIVGVSQVTPFESITMMQFTIGIFFISIVTMLAIYDSVWSRIKAKNCNK